MSFGLENLENKMIYLIKYKNGYWQERDKYPGSYL